MSGGCSSTSNGRARRASATPQKYFLGRVYADGRMVPFVIWNGVRGYSSEPPFPHLTVEFRMRGAAGGRLGVITTRAGNRAKSLITCCVPAFDAIVLWTRDRRAYRTAVDQLSEE